MRTPVIIAARNESEHVGPALDALARQSSETYPIVVVNGSTDNTAEIAQSRGAVVLESAEGKMPAIQEGLRFLGDRALEPVLIMDADSRPFTKRWSRHMTSELRGLTAHEPAIVWGPYVLYKEINPLLGALFTAKSMRVSWQDRKEERPRTIRGGNTGLYIKEDELLEELLALKNYWPREDVAIFDTMKSHNAAHKVTFKPDGVMLTSGYRSMDTIRKIVKSRKHPSKVMDDSYAEDAPWNSEPYFSETTDTVPHEKS